MKPGRILMNDFTAEPPELRAEVRAAVERVLRSGWFVLGAEVQSFEREFAAYCGSAHAIGVANGLDAIEIALRALGIGRGDEVVTTGMTAFATVLGVIRAGATPVIADIDPATGLLSVASAERCLSKKTKALLPVHLYGNAVMAAQWSVFCKSNGIHLIEDCAQAHGATLNGTCAGAFGSIGAYSFYPTKNLGAAGDGGCVVTGDSELSKICSELRNYGQSRRYEHPSLGMNSRLDEIQAAILRARLRWLDQFNSRRREIAGRYYLEFANKAVTLLERDCSAKCDVFHLFVVKIAARDLFIRHLEHRGIQTLIHYPIPAHLQPPCGGVARDPAGLAELESFARGCVSLPCHPQMRDDEVTAVINAVNEFSE